MNAPLEHFELLCNSIRARAYLDIKHGCPDNQLVRWRKLFIAILETELAMHRVKTSLNLLKVIPTKEALNRFSVSEGSWIDYHCGACSFWTCSLLDKAIELVRQVGQRLIKPNNPQYKDVVSSLIKVLVDHKGLVGEIRHPLAHKGKGGFIEEVINKSSPKELKEFATTISPLDWSQQLSSYTNRHAILYNHFRELSVIALEAIYAICGILNQHIDWDNI